MSEAERGKYERLWADRRYRHHSPGLHHVDRLCKLFQPTAGQTLTDYGCGPGLAALEFQRRGLDVLALDFAANSLAPKVQRALGHTLRFRREDLAKLHDDVPSVDYCFCTDVMEHLLLEEVDGVIEAIAHRTGLGGLFAIATRPDSCGRLIGDTLHLTVRPASWWQERLRQRFEVEMRAHRGSAVFVVRRRDCVP